MITPFKTDECQKEQAFQPEKRVSEYFIFLSDEQYWDDYSKISNKIHRGKDQYPCRAVFELIHIAIFKIKAIVQEYEQGKQQYGVCINDNMKITFNIIPEYFVK